jgi:hypothetical protein
LTPARPLATWIGPPGSMITKDFFLAKDNYRIGAKKLRDHAEPADHAE